MANISNLKIYINPAKVPGTQTDNTALDATGIASYGTQSGYIAFDEVAEVIYVNGKAYGFDTTVAASLATALTDIATLKGTVETQGSVLYIVNDELTSALGTLSESLVTGDNTDTTVKTVAELISALKTQINALDSAAVKRSTGSGETDYANTQAIATAIATAKSDVIGTDAQGTIWGQNEEQTLTHLKALLNTITGGSSNIDLAGIAATIEKIEQELQDGEGTGYVDTLLDAYKALASSDGTYTVGSTSNITTLAGIITALEGLITANSTADQGYTDTQISGLLGTSGTAGNTVYGAKKDAADAASAAADAAAEAAKHTSVTENSSYLDIATSTNAVGGTQYQISTTSAFDTVASNASAAKSATDTLTGDANTTGSLAKAVADLKGASGDASTAETIAGAKAYADSVAASQASSAAGQVISWETIGASS